MRVLCSSLSASIALQQIFIMLVAPNSVTELKRAIHRGHWAPMQSAKGWKHSGGIAHVSCLFAFSKNEEKIGMFLHIMRAAKCVKHSK